MPIHEDSDERIKASAREWLLHLMLEPPTAQDRARFTDWYLADPRHAEAYRRFQSIWQSSENLKELAHLAAFEAVPGGARRSVAAVSRGRPLMLASRIAAVMVMGLFAWLIFLAPARYSTNVGQVRLISLSDGSEVTLGARSSMEVGYRAEERRLALTSGEAFFSVAKNPARPFIVVVGDKQVRAIGTKFEVWRDAGAIRVSVVEGTVEVTQPANSLPHALTTYLQHPLLSVRQSASRASTDISRTPSVQTQSNGGSVVMTAGQQVTGQIGGAIDGIEIMPQVEPASWRRGRLVYIDAPLREVIADANRYSREAIVIGDPQIAEWRVSVTYSNDGIDQMLTALSKSLPLDIEHSTSKGILLKVRKSDG